MGIDARMCHGRNADRHFGRQGLWSVFGLRSFLAIAYHGIAIVRFHPQHAFVLIRSAGRLVSERHPSFGRGSDLVSTAVYDCAPVAWISAVVPWGNDCEHSLTRRRLGHLYFDLAVALQFGELEFVGVRATSIFGEITMKDSSFDQTEPLVVLPD
jgi:hypothetical protein